MELILPVELYNPAPHFNCCACHKDKPLDQIGHTYKNGHPHSHGKAYQCKACCHNAEVAKTTNKYISSTGVERLKTSKAATQRKAAKAYKKGKNLPKWMFD